MAFDRLKNSSLSNAAHEAWVAFGDLAQTEFLLAKAELSSKLSRKVRGSIWIVGASALALVAIILAALSIAFAISSYGIPLHWALASVAILTAALAVGAFLIGRTDATVDLTPTRTLHQIRQDIDTAKERLS